MKIGIALMTATGLFYGIGVTFAADTAPAGDSDLQQRRVLMTGRLAAMRVGLLAVDLADRSTQAAVDADRPLIPASTMKILTTACALDRLGPAYVFATDFLATTALDSDGRLLGPLYIRGTGNPLFRAEDLWVALAELKANGLRQVTGGIVFDDSLFEAPTRPSTWPNRRVSDPYDAPQGALAVSWNSVQVIVAASKSGKPARISTFPLEAGVRIRNAVRTASSTRITMTVVESSDGIAEIEVGGTIRRGARPYKNWVHLADPGRATAEALADFLANADVGHEGSIRRAKTPPSARLLLSHKSPPLAQIVAAINKYSSNFGAEMLVRALDPHLGSKPATTGGGLSTLERCLARWKISRKGTTLSDGSGYSRSNRLTSKALVETLVHAWNSPEWGPEFVASLPRAGEDGSLENRLHHFKGRVRAKTGSLNGVTTLAGYAQTDDGRTIAFAILANRTPKVSPTRGDVDEVLKRLLALPKR